MLTAIEGNIPVKTNRAIAEAEETARKAWDIPDDPGYSPFFDIRKSYDWYRRLIKQNGLQSAREIALPVLTKDLYTQAWEAIDGRKPCEYGYRITTSGGEQRLVHESDIYNNRDIKEGLNPSIRRGKERLGILNFRQAILDARVGDTVIQASPMKHAVLETRQDCYYPDTFFTVAEKISETEVSVRQVKSRFVTPEQSGRVVNRIYRDAAIRQGRNETNSKAPIPDVNDLDSIITTAVTIQGSLKTEDLIRTMENESGVEIPEGPELEGMKIRAGIWAEMLRDAFEKGYSPDFLGRLHAGFLAKVIGVDRGVTSSKISYTPGGGISISLNCGSVSLGASYRQGYNSSSFMGGSGETWKPGVCDSCGNEKEILCGFCKECGSNRS